MKTFIFAFNSSLGSQQSVLDFLDTRPEILNWLNLLPQSIVLVSEKTVSELTDIIRSKYPGHHFIVSEISGLSSNGFLGKTSWEFINHPKSSGRWS